MPIFIYFICGMPTTAWRAKRCHVRTRDSNRWTPGHREAECANFTTAPLGQPLDAFLSKFQEGTRITSYRLALINLRSQAFGQSPPGLLWPHICLTYQRVCQTLLSCSLWATEMQKDRGWQHTFSLWLSSRNTQPNWQSLTPITSRFPSSAICSYGQWSSGEFQVGCKAQALKTEESNKISGELKVETRNIGFRVCKPGFSGHTPRKVNVRRLSLSSNEKTWTVIGSWAVTLNSGFAKVIAFSEGRLAFGGLCHFENTDEASALNSVSADSFLAPPPWVFLLDVRDQIHLGSWCSSPHTPVWWR